MDHNAARIIIAHIKVNVVEHHQVDVKLRATVSLSIQTVLFANMTMNANLAVVKHLQKNVAQGEIVVPLLNHARLILNAQLKANVVIVSFHTALKLRAIA